MSIILLILFAIFAFLVWIEAIPVKKWIYAIHIKVVGRTSRFFVALFDCIDKAEKWIDNL